MHEQYGCLNDVGYGKLLTPILNHLRTSIRGEKNELERTRLTIKAASVCQLWRNFFLKDIYSALVFEIYDTRPPPPETETEESSDDVDDEDDDAYQARISERNRQRRLQRVPYHHFSPEDFAWRTNANLIVGNGLMHLTTEVVMRGRYGYDFNTLAYMLPTWGANHVDWPNVKKLSFVGHMGEGSSDVFADDVQVFIDMVFDKMPNINDIRYGRRMLNNKQFVCFLLALLYHYLPDLRTLGLDHLLPFTYPLKYSPELTRVRIDPTFVKAYHNFPPINPKPLRWLEIFGVRSDYIWSYFQQPPPKEGEYTLLEFPNLEYLHLDQVGSVWTNVDMPDGISRMKLSFPKIQELHLVNMLRVYPDIFEPFANSKLRKLTLEEHSAQILDLPESLYLNCPEIHFMVQDARYSYKVEKKDRIEKIFSLPSNVRKMSINYTIHTDNFAWHNLRSLKIKLLLVNFQIPEYLMQAMPNLRCLLITFPPYNYEEKDVDNAPIVLDRDLLAKCKLEFLSLMELRVRDTEYEYVKGLLRKYPTLCDIQLPEEMVPLMKEFAEEEGLDIFIGTFNKGDGIVSRY